MGLQNFTLKNLLHQFQRVHFILLPQAKNSVNFQIFFIEFSSKNFTRFVNMLINDTTFLLDESIDALRNIHDTQELIANKPEWEKLTHEMRTSRQRQLATDERQCKSYLTLATETVDMLHHLTQEIKPPFLEKVSKRNAIASVH